MQNGTKVPCTKLAITECHLAMVTEPVCMPCSACRVVIHTVQLVQALLRLSRTVCHNTGSTPIGGHMKCVRLGRVEICLPNRSTPNRSTAHLLWVGADLGRKIPTQLGFEHGSPARAAGSKTFLVIASNLIFHCSSPSLGGVKLKFYLDTI